LILRSKTQKRYNLWLINEAVIRAKMRKFFICGVLLVVFGYGNTIPTQFIDDLSPEDDIIGLSLDEYSKSINDFSQEFMRQVWADRQNFVFSPLSMHIALSMLASSATENSTTQKQLLQILGRTKNLENLEKYYQTTLADYEKNSANTFKFGNKVWTSKDLFAEINDTYLEALDTKYKTGFSFLEDVEPEKAVNEWISEVTNKKINKLFDELPGTVSLLLTNALWFKDSWNQPFDEVLEPERKDYFLSNGSKIQVEMMERTSYGFVVSDVFQFKGLTNDQNFKAIAVPYQSDDNGRFELVAVIPETVKGMEFLKESLTNQVTYRASSYENIFDTIEDQIQFGRSKNEEYTIVMPQFKISTDIQAEDYLRMMGVTDAFDVGDFGYLAKQTPLRVSGVKHKSIVEVNIQGTEGAAATGIDLVPLSFSDFREVRIDRPFIFFIKDRYKGSLLFVGKIENPTENGVGPR